MPPARRGLEREYARETEVDASAAAGAAGADDDGWLMTHETSNRSAKDEELETIDDIDGLGGAHAAVPPPPPPAGPTALREASAASAAAEDSDEYLDMEDFEDDNLLDDDDAAAADLAAPMAAVSLDAAAGCPPSGASETKDAGTAAGGASAGAPAAASNVLATRTYDLSISYDKYYQTPRVWLFGYDEASQPLSQAQVFEDIMQDYANRTVTMEAHPHAPGAMLTASIHPCKHADVMKRIIGHLAQGASGRAPTSTCSSFSSLSVDHSDGQLRLYLFRPGRVKPGSGAGSVEARGRGRWKAP